MARPRQNASLEEFTTGHLMVAGGLTRRNTLLLAEKDYLPDIGTVGDETHRVGTIRTVKHIAGIGAFHKAGVELIPAARMMAVISGELEAAYGELPAGFDLYLQRPLNPNPGNYPWDHRDGDPDSRNDFWFHHLLVTRAEGIYRRGQAMVGDFVIEVADRQYVYTDMVRKPADIPIIGGVQYSATPMFKVIGWERGENAEILPIHDEADRMGQYFPETPEERLRHLQREYLMAHAHAVGLIRVNVSLAIRNALDAIHAYRTREKTPD